jgi:DNA-directed RNA polymerase omega subunit
MSNISPEQFDDKIDSLYRLVIVAARRAAQVAKPESRPLIKTSAKKPAMIALQEIKEGKVVAWTGEGDEESFFE